MATRVYKLTERQYLSANSPYTLASSDNQFVAEVTADGVLRIRNIFTGTITWTTVTDGSSSLNIVSVTLLNGSLVGVNVFGVAVFHTACHTTRTDSYFQVETNGSGTVYNFLYASEWKTNCALYPLQRLYLGRSIVDPYISRHVVKFDSTGVLVLNSGANLGAWKSTNEPGVATSASYVTVLPSGEVVMYSAEGGEVLWSTSTANLGTSWLRPTFPTGNASVDGHVDIASTNSPSTLFWRSGMPRVYGAGKNMLLNGEGFDKGRSLISASGAYAAYVLWSAAWRQYQFIIVSTTDPAIVSPKLRFSNLVKLVLQNNEFQGFSDFANTTSLFMSGLQTLHPELANALNRVHLSDAGVVSLVDKAGTVMWSMNSTLFPQQSSALMGKPVISPDGLTSFNLNMSGSTVSLALVRGGATLWSSSFTVPGTLRNAYLGVNFATFALQLGVEYVGVYNLITNTVVWQTPAASTKACALYVSNSGNAQFVDFVTRTVLWKAVAVDPVPDHIPFALSFPAGGRPLQRYNAGKCANTNFPCAKFFYFVMGTFVAHRPFVYVSVNNGSAQVSGGSGNDWTEADYVLISYNNVTADQPDPTSATYKSPKDYQTINVGANVLASGPKAQINGRGTVTVGGLSNFKVTLETGKQYAVAFRLYCQSDDDTTLSWGASSIRLATE